MKKLGMTATFYFPVKDNDGNSLQIEIGRFENYLIHYFKGYSDLGTIKDFWKNNFGQVFEDENRVFEVSGTDESTAERLAIKIKVMARQEAVYFKIDGVAYLV